jgi:hypothetical protein
MAVSRETLIKARDRGYKGLEDLVGPIRATITQPEAGKIVWIRESPPPVHAFVVAVGYYQGGKLVGSSALVKDFPTLAQAKAYMAKLASAEAGTWSRAKGCISVTLKKYRRVGGKTYDFKAKYLGSPDDPASPWDVEHDLKETFGKRFRLVPTSPRGGRILEG